MAIDSAVYRLLQYSRIVYTEQYGYRGGGVSQGGAGMRCLQCHTVMIVTRGDWPYRVREVPNLVLVDIEISTCPRCGDEEVSVPNILALHEEIMHLTQQDTEVFMEAFRNPPEPNEALQRAARFSQGKWRIEGRGARHTS